MLAKNLESLDLSFNLIEFINKTDFESNVALRSIDISHNLIKYIHFQAFRKVVNLETLINKSYSLANLLSSGITSLDFSENDLRNNYTIFEVLVNIEELVLSRVNLDSMQQINFANFTKLKKLDLSINNLSRIETSSFLNLKSLEYLDLSENKIQFIDENIFSLINNLKYLNLENNRIDSVGMTFLNYLNLQVINLSKNQLRYYPTIQRSTAGNFIPILKEAYFQNNKILSITFFTSFTWNLQIVNFDSNEILSIDKNALLNLKSLKNLSISNNKLETIKADYFYYLYSLKYLNLSSNRIKAIENNSFQNLNKLLSLDLSYNNLKTIENNIFYGLVDLKDLYLTNDFIFEIKNQSFNYLSNISNIYMNEKMFVDPTASLINKCIFMHSIVREIKRKVGNKYIYYKSINILTEKDNFFNRNETLCDLTMNFLQFKIHFNLKTDTQFEFFYEKCKNQLIRISNNFNHTKKLCFGNFLFYYEKDLDEKFDTRNNFAKIFSNEYFLVTIFIVLGFLFPFFVYVFVFELNTFKNKKATIKKQQNASVSQNGQNDSGSRLRLVSCNCCSYSPTDSLENLTPNHLVTSMSAIFSSKIVVEDLKEVRPMSDKHSANDKTPYGEFFTTPLNQES